MSVFTADPNQFLFRYTNAAAPATSPGTSVTPGATNAEGSATVIATGANIASDCYWLLLAIHGGNTTATSKMHLIDIGVDPAGGTSYQWLVQNLQCGSSSAFQAGAIWIPVPLFIKTGGQVAVRIQGLSGTAGTVIVLAKFLGKPTRPELCQHLTKSETLGTIASSCGTAVTPGTSAAEGAWTSIGTTGFQWRFAIPTLQMNDTSTAAATVFMDVAYGDASNKVMIAENLPVCLPGTAEVAQSNLLALIAEGWCDIPSGATIYVRLSTSIATAETCNVLVTGLG
jgi:hypothetical protein